MKPPNISRQRILAQVKKLSNQKLSYLVAAPLPDDLYNWHFTIQGPENTQFHQGLYHGQIILPFEYPFKPPDIVFMNKNGRFQTNTKICLTITQYHPQEWNSAWTIRTMLEAVISLFAQNVQGVGSLASSADVRKFLAKKSHSFVCQNCGPIKQLITPRNPFGLEHSEGNHSKGIKQFQENIQMRNKIEKENEAKQILDFKNKVIKQQRNQTELTKDFPILKKKKLKKQLDSSQLSKDDIFQKYDEGGVQRIEIYQGKRPLPIEWISKVKQIGKNFKELDSVFKSIKWVD